MADDSKTDLTRTALAWVAGQPFNNVLILVGLVMIGWIAHYTVTVAEPARLKSIQDGYQRIEESSSKDRLLIIQQYDKWFDHIKRERQGDDTGHVDPSQIFENVWSSENEHSGFFGQQIANVGANEAIQSTEEVEIETAGGNKFSLVRNARSTESGRYVPWVDSGRDRRGVGTDGSAFDAAEWAVRRPGKLPGSLTDRAQNER